MTATISTSSAAGPSDPALGTIGPPARHTIDDTFFPRREIHLRGKHKQFFDGMTINEGFALAFALDFLDAYNQAYKIPDRELCAVVGLRHMAVPMAFTDSIWAKYKLGEFFKLLDPATKQPLTRKHVLPRACRGSADGRNVD